MYLKKIEASGFKSFADKTLISLDGKITCIVGPNGSGKSNIVDAVRWVLGEQSVKSLRGEGSMSDVIFSGSKSRNPLNVASVELVFDNSDHSLNIPYTEISIKRRVYRSGENEYYLNNEKCRLKDINNLLMDSLMGKESFNIISQGEVDRLLSNSSYDRRIVFEEAAGILKYKKRKEEALRKLDRTHNNIDRVNDIISELELQVGPLKEQSEKALEYLENKKGLDKYEVALLAYDIENINNELDNNRKKKEKIDREIFDLSLSTDNNDSKFLQENKEIEELEKKYNSLNNQLFGIIEEKEKLDAEINILRERSKNNNDEDKINDEIRLLLEKKERLNGSISIISKEISSIDKMINDEQEESLSYEKKLNDLKLKKNILISDFSTHNKELISLQHKINSLKEEIEQSGDMPNSVKKILKCDSLYGIYNTIGNVLTTDEQYIKALNVAIQFNKNFIITKDEASAKKAVNYLKDNHLGRATFFPMTVIKERYVDRNTLDLIKNNSEYIGILSDLVSYNNEYDAIIKNQLGIVIVVSNIDAATNISHLIGAKYKIVTLDGDVINVGGSITGGSNYHGKSSITMRQEITNLENRIKLLNDESDEISKELEEIDKDIIDNQDVLFDISKKIVNLKEKRDTKKKEKESLESEYDKVDKDYSSMESIKNNSVSEKEKELIKLFHEKKSYKEQFENDINLLKREISSRKEKLEQQQADDRVRLSKIRSLEKNSKELEITINRSDVKLENMLNTLNVEYELTFERAKNDFSLDIEPDDARRKVELYKANIKKIGMVNINAIEEFEKVNNRYLFLTNQKEDLLKAESTLLEIMNEMDEVMKEEFYNTFIKIKEEFNFVFKELFKGGFADLKLTNPDDLLMTGVDIIASPPGKKLTSISLLSGGEKTLTAISLLFAILNIKSVPFCLFDEVEAALDEANVIQFGKYLNHYRDKTQFLIITHKKKTMEYANTLYGITMQESGVSKLVSVKLENHEKIL